METYTDREPIRAKGVLQFTPIGITVSSRFCHTIVTFFTVLCVCQGLRAEPPKNAHNAPMVSGRSVVASDHPLASEIGAKIIKQGGNAVDAGVATLLALGVLNPFASGIGGGGFCLYNDGVSPETTVLDFRETAPAAATADMFIVDGKADIGKTIVGGLAVGIPGEIAGLHAMHKKYGKLKWSQVVKPARLIAQNGFPVGELLPKRLKSKAKKLEAFPKLSSAFKKNGRYVTAGETLRRPELAKTLRAVEQKGPDGFYRGEIAKGIVETVNSAGGRFAESDLENYKPTWRKPLVGSYRGYPIHTMPPPSSGGTTLLETLNILERYDMKTLGNSAEATHRVVEALKHAFADRARWLGDADFVTVPVDELISKEYARTKRVDAGGVLEIDRYGKTAPPPNDDGTSHMNATSGEDVLSCTSTINTSFGSLVYVAEHGILMNNEMGDFTAQPGVPNNYGLMGTKQNEVAPGKRPLSSMTPSIVFRCKEERCKPWIGVGGSGGPTIITGTLLAIQRAIDWGVNASEAVSLPRLHHQWLPNTIFIEALPASWQTVLEKRGHAVNIRPAYNAVQIIMREKGAWFGASDPRKKGLAAANK